jgi:hypothetical protein
MSSVPSDLFINENIQSSHPPDISWLVRLYNLRGRRKHAIDAFDFDIHEIGFEGMEGGMWRMNPWPTWNWRCRKNLERMWNGPLTMEGWGNRYGTRDIRVLLV